MCSHQDCECFGKKKQAKTKKTKMAHKIATFLRKKKFWGTLTATKYNKLLQPWTIRAVSPPLESDQRPAALVATRCSCENSPRGWGQIQFELDVIWSSTM